MAHSVVYYTLNTKHIVDSIEKGETCVCFFNLCIATQLAMNWQTDVDHHVFCFANLLFCQRIIIFLTCVCIMPETRESEKVTCLLCCLPFYYFSFFLSPFAIYSFCRAPSSTTFFFLLSFHCEFFSLFSSFKTSSFHIFFSLFII